MRQAVKLETRTHRGRVEAFCKKHDQWHPLDKDTWYFHAGQDMPYLAHCRAYERERSSAWHKADRAKKADGKPKVPAKSVIAKARKRNSAPAKSAAKKTAAARKRKPRA